MLVNGIDTAITTLGIR